MIQTKAKRVIKKSDTNAKISKQENSMSLDTKKTKAKKVIKKSSASAKSSKNEKQVKSSAKNNKKTHKTSKVKALLNKLLG